MMTKAEWNKVLEELVKVPMFEGKFDRKNANFDYIAGIITVMDYIAVQADKEDEFDERWSANAKPKEYCPDPDNEFDCPYLDPETRECTIGNQKEECADFDWDEEEEEEEEE